MPMSYRDLVARVRAGITETTTGEVEGRLAEIPVLIDIREVDEFEQGAIPGAKFVPRGILESNIARLVPDPDTEIVLYCQAGNRSALSAKSLEEMGYTRVSSMAGGFTRWKTEGRSWEAPKGLDAEQRARYSRHILLPEVGEEGQEKLLRSRVLLVGAGGLGSPSALYLAAAGVGTLGIVDDDIVDATNLQRQIIHGMDRVGMLKVESAAETIRNLNPDVKVETYSQRLAVGNVLQIMGQYDVVVDGADNFPTRYLVNDASLHLRVPVVHGSIFRFEGQVTVFDPYVGPCYRCLFPEPPPPELAPNCAEAGVLGVLPGIIGSLEAMEAIKLLLGIGDPLTGRLLTYDSLSEEFRTLKLRRSADCPACADEGRVPQLVQYDDACVPAGLVERA
ncbi:MAG TPA: molybdopterin-synthase adenylyltransferase MoeB [Acidimicrobiia bacterium]|nr:molybdopterin-synthase adenylyltransferase MoeB [Acidimicrobiia bacterium]